MTHPDQYTLDRIEIEEELLKLQKKLESDFLRYEDLYIEELKVKNMTQHRFYGLRGEAYGLLKEKIHREESEAIAAYFNDVRTRTGKFTAKDLGAIAMHFRIPLTVMDDLLNKIVGFPVGTWDRLKDKGCKARDIGVIWK